MSGLGKLGEAVVEAIKDERQTRTGKINLASIAMLVIMDLGLALPTLGEVITNGILVGLGKQPEHVLPESLLPWLIVGTFMFAFVCLFVVRDMERKKHAKRKGKRTVRV